jgi:ATP synthase protein I
MSDGGVMANGKPKMQPTDEAEEPSGGREGGAQRQDTRTFWFGVGMLGLVGWSVVMPVLVGAGLGFWLDANHPASHSWMLLLMPIGLVLGIFNAWRWVSRDRAGNRGPGGN